MAWSTEQLRVVSPRLPATSGPGDTDVDTTRETAQEYKYGIRPLHRYARQSRHVLLLLQSTPTLLFAYKLVLGQLHAYLLANLPSSSKIVIEVTTFPSNCGFSDVVSITVKLLSLSITSSLVILISKHWIAPLRERARNTISSEDIGT